MYPRACRPLAWTWRILSGSTQAFLDGLKGIRKIRCTMMRWHPSLVSPVSGPKATSGSNDKTSPDTGVEMWIWAMSPAETL